MEKVLLDMANFIKEEEEKISTKQIKAYFEGREIADFCEDAAHEFRIFLRRIVRLIRVLAENPNLSFEELNPNLSFEEWIILEKGEKYNVK
jgi:hypothetical protein